MREKGSEREGKFSRGHHNVQRPSRKRSPTTDHQHRPCHGVNKGRSYLCTIPVKACDKVSPSLKADMSSISSLDPLLERRVLRLKGKFQEGGKDDCGTLDKVSKVSSVSTGTKRKTTNLNVSWADQKEAPLSTSCLVVDEPSLVRVKSADPSPSQGRNNERSTGPPTNQWIKKGVVAGTEKIPQGSYKEAILRNLQHPTRSTSDFTHRPLVLKPSSRPPKLGAFAFKGRCFRCLAQDHIVCNCRDPLRCLWCFKLGHPAFHCRDGRVSVQAKMQRALSFHTPSLKVFVPLTDGFHSRQNLCRNAVLASIIGPDRLGHCPLEMLANDFASRFGEYSNDFHVARSRERDFVIFLPQWMQPEEILNREVIRLPHCKIRLFERNPYRNASRSLLTYKAWIKLVNLTFECLSKLRVASMSTGLEDILEVMKIASIC